MALVPLMWSPPSWPAIPPGPATGVPTPVRIGSWYHLELPGMLQSLFTPQIERDSNLGGLDFLSQKKKGTLWEHYRVPPPPGAICST